MKMYSITDLKNVARDIRKDILLMSYRAKSAHTGGALSCVEILVTLYFRTMKVFPKFSNHADRDRLIFSKAHDAKALYAALSRRGFFDKQVLEGYEADGGFLPGHSTRNCVPGVEVSAGSLGHGLPMACGIAFAGKMDKKQYRVFAVLSDGECDEGSTWEAALFAGHHKLNNLTVIVDYNKLQGYGYTVDVLELEPFAKKWESFHWQVQEVDGHNITELIAAFSTDQRNSDQPRVVIAHTVKGLGGVSKHVNQVSSQYKSPTEEELHIALKELENL